MTIMGCCCFPGRRGRTPPMRFDVPLGHEELDATSQSNTTANASSSLGTPNDNASAAASIKPISASSQSNAPVAQKQSTATVTTVSSQSPTQQQKKESSPSAESRKPRKKSVSWGYVHPLCEDGNGEESFRITVDNTPQRLPPPADLTGDKISADAGRPKKQAIMSVEADDPPPPIADSAEAMVHIAPPKTMMRKFFSFFHAGQNPSQGTGDLRQIL